jgi:hypothetical protein
MLMNYAEICQKEINKLIVIYLISEYQWPSSDPN